MAITEHTINDALALALRDGRRAWRKSGVVYSETTGMLRGGSTRPDILVLEPDVSPVVIETEVVPATTVEPDALGRLGKSVKKSGLPILSSIAVRLPQRLRRFDSGTLRSELVTATDFEMAMYTGRSASDAVRWPRDQWIKGGLPQLSFLAQAASVPPEVIDQAADELTAGIEDAAALFTGAAGRYPGAMNRIADELRQAAGEQTWRMAAAILVNAFVFHESLAGGRGALESVASIEELKSTNALTKATVIAEWRKVLEINYWSIFDIARRLLEHMPSAISRDTLEILAETSDRLLARRLMRSHDLTGAVFQRLIADRRFLAAYYTTPAAAALLAGLAVREDKTPAGTSWHNTEALRRMRIADFACGTGTLLSAVYQRVGQLHEMAGGDASKLHSYMMGGSLVGCDVLPAAAHLTAATLSSVHPQQRYAESSIMTLAYGRLEDDGVALGSLDLLDPQRKFEILAITARAAEGTGETIKDIWSSLPHAGFDLVIMNPPFTRATGQAGARIGVVNPMFAAFEADSETQRLMGRTLAKLTSGTAAHGNAGEASIFMVLADRKLKEGGTVALVLPLSFMLGEAWEASRDTLVRRYGDLIFVSNAGVGGADVSFSADTDIAECLVTGRKTGKPSKRATFVTLNERPHSTVAGANIAIQIQNSIAGRVRKLEDGPSGGTPIILGAEVVGFAIDAPIENGWNLARVRDASVAQTAFQLLNGKVWLPGSHKSKIHKISVTTIGKLGMIGPYHADVNGRTSGGGIRGPFDVVDAHSGGAPTYPVLWKHEAERERTIEFEAESEGVPRQGISPEEQGLIDAKINTVWASASHLHFNRDFRFNSQSTAMQYTRRPTIGGRAWLSIKLDTRAHEKAMALWANTTFGLMLHWWHASKQQAGRGSIGKSSLEDLSVFDVRTLSSKQLSAVEEVFDACCGIALRPLDELDSDEARHELDFQFFTKVLGLPKMFHEQDGLMQTLRMKLAREPSIVG